MTIDHTYSFDIMMARPSLTKITCSIVVTSRNLTVLASRSGTVVRADSRPFYCSALFLFPPSLSTFLLGGYLTHRSCCNYTANENRVDIEGR